MKDKIAQIQKGCGKKYGLSNCGDKSTKIGSGDNIILCPLCKSKLDGIKIGIIESISEERRFLGEIFGTDENTGNWDYRDFKIQDRLLKLKGKEFQLNIKQTKTQSLVQGDEI